MLLFSHIAFAVLSIVITGYTALSPSSLRLKFTYFSIFATTLSGLVLAVFNHSNLGTVCISGAAYFASILILLRIIKKAER